MTTVQSIAPPLPTLSVRATANPSKSFRFSSLRLSVTDRCNLNCRYCKPHGIERPESTLQRKSLSELSEAIILLCQWLSLKKIKITGGEPLLRSDLEKLIRDVSGIEQIEDISMTTNALLLNSNAKSFKRAGLDRVNISLDTLNPSRFKSLTGGGRLKTALDGISNALAAGLFPIKVNAVLHKSSWREDVPSLIEYCADRSLELRLIELMHTGVARDWSLQEYIPATVVIKWLKSEGNLKFEDVETLSASRTAEIDLYGKRSRIGFITPQSEPFCDGCERLRMDASGRLKRCLMDGASYPFVDSLKSLSSGQLQSEVFEYLDGKTPPKLMSTNETMVGIGG